MIMFTNLKSTLRRALLGAILAGATIFSAPTTGCDPAGAKDVSGNAAKIIPMCPPHVSWPGQDYVP
jgi:hypothetical protein